MNYNDKINKIATQISEENEDHYSSEAILRASIKMYENLGDDYYKLSNEEKKSFLDESELGIDNIINDDPWIALEDHVSDLPDYILEDYDLLRRFETIH